MKNTRKIIFNNEKIKENNYTLKYSINKKAGRNNRGSITVRHQGGGHKKLYRKIDFKRDLYGLVGKVTSIDYDPYRTSSISLVNYYKLFNRYIITPNGLKVGDTVNVKNSSIEYNIGDTIPVKNINPNTLFHNVEIKKNKGGQLARSAGTYGKVLKKLSKDKYVIELSSKKKYIISGDNKVTIGQVSNVEHMHRKLKKAGNSRWLGIRPTVRGVAMNPVDHPHGGGEGKTSGGRLSVSPKGKLSKGKKTVKKKKNITIVI